MLIFEQKIHLRWLTLKYVTHQTDYSLTHLALLYAWLDTYTIDSLSLWPTDLLTTLEYTNVHNLYKHTPSLQARSLPSLVMLLLDTIGKVGNTLPWDDCHGNNAKRVILLIVWSGMGYFFYSFHDIVCIGLIDRKCSVHNSMFNKHLQQQ